MNDLPPFSGDTPQCIKCGYRGNQDSRWVPAGFITGTGHQGECLERTCGRCGYTWAEARVTDFTSESDADLRQTTVSCHVRGDKAAFGRAVVEALHEYRRRGGNL